MPTHTFLTKSTKIDQLRPHNVPSIFTRTNTATMADEDEIAALVIDNGSGMCKGGSY
jgi:hypothetical protein